MTTYVTASDIAKYYDQVKTFSSSTTVTDTEVAAHIVLQTNYVLGRISNNYDISNPSTNDTNTIKMLIEFKVVHIIDGVFREQTSEISQFNFKRNLGKTAEDYLKMIDDGKFKLDATKSQNLPIKFNRGTNSSGDYVDPLFTIEDADPDTWE